MSSSPCCGCRSCSLAARHTAPRVHDGVDVTAYPVLFVIASAGSVRVSDIAGSLHSDVSTVSRQVSALAGHGLVAKEADPSDGRAQVASLTEEGRYVLARSSRPGPRGSRVCSPTGTAATPPPSSASCAPSATPSTGTCGHAAQTLPILPFDSTQEN